MNEHTALIFIRPFRETLEKLKESISENAEEDKIEIFECNDTNEANQLIPTIGQSIIIMDNPKGCAVTLKINHKRIKANGSKVILLSQKTIKKNILDKFDKLGLTECIIEPVAAKTLQYKVKLHLRSIAVKEDKGVIHSKIEEKKIDKEKVEKSSDKMRIEKLMSVSLDDEDEEKDEDEVLKNDTENINHHNQERIEKLLIDNSDNTKSQKKKKNTQLDLGGHYKQLERNSDLNFREVKEQEVQDYNQNNNESIAAHYKSKEKTDFDLFANSENGPVKENLDDNTLENDELSLVKNDLMLDIQSEIENEEIGDLQPLVDEQNVKSSNNDLELDLKKNEKKENQGQDSSDEDLLEIKKIDQDNLELQSNKPLNTKLDDLNFKNVEKSLKSKTDFTLQEQEGKDNKNKDNHIENISDNQHIKSTSDPLQIKNSDQNKTKSGDEEDVEENITIKDYEKLNLEAGGSDDPLVKLDLNIKDMDNVLDQIEDNIDFEEKNKNKNNLDIQVNEEEIKKKKDNTEEELVNNNKKNKDSFSILEVDDKEKKSRADDLKINNEQKTKEPNLDNIDEGDLELKKGHMTDEVEYKMKKLTPRAKDKHKNLGNRADAHAENIETHYSSQKSLHHNSDEWQSDAYEKGRRDDDFSNHQERGFSYERNVKKGQGGPLDYNNKNKSDLGEQTIDYEQIRRQFENINLDQNDKKRKRKGIMRSSLVKVVDREKTIYGDNGEEENVIFQEIVEDVEVKDVTVFTPQSNGLDIAIKILNLYMMPQIKILDVARYIANHIHNEFKGSTNFFFYDKVSEKFAEEYCGHIELNIGPPPKELSIKEQENYNKDELKQIKKELALEKKEYEKKSAPFQEEWDNIKEENIDKWSSEKLPTWDDGTFQSADNHFTYPIYEGQDPLGFAIVTFKEVFKEENAKVIEIILESSRGLYLEKVHIINGEKDSYEGKKNKEKDKTEKKGFFGNLFKKKAG